VFQGTWEGVFAAYHANSGEKLWQYRSDSAVLAGPISYELDNEQYIAVAQGSGGAVMLTVGDEIRRNKVNQNKLLVFKLGRSNQTKPLIDNSIATILALDSQSAADLATIKKGETLYGRNCSACHGISAKSNYIVPDLRYMSAQTHSEFIAIVLGGSRTHKGMLGFYETLNYKDVEAIHAYLKQEQQALPSKLEMSFWQKIEYWFTYGMAKIGEKYPDLLNATRDMMM
jgi:cytochrome c553